MGRSRRTSKMILPVLVVCLCSRQNVHLVALPVDSFERELSGFSFLLTKSYYQTYKRLQFPRAGLRATVPNISFNKYINITDPLHMLSRFMVTGFLFRFASITTCPSSIDAAQGICKELVSSSGLCSGHLNNCFKTFPFRIESIHRLFDIYFFQHITIMNQQECYRLHKMQFF